MKKAVLILIVLLTTGFTIAQNPRNVVLYNLTSTGCGPCSCMDSLIRHAVIPLYPKTVVIALHSPISMGGSAFWDYQGNQIYFQFRSKSEPDGFIDGLGYDVFYTHIADSVGKRYEHSPEAPVKIEINAKTWDPSSRMIDLSTRITNIGSELPGSYWYNIFITEDNIKMVHRVATGCATPDDPHGQPLRYDYFNDHVTRKVEFFEHGDSLIGPNWPAGQEIVKDFSIKIDTPWIPENCRINLIVYHHTDSLYTSAIQQAISQTVTGGVGVEPVNAVPSSTGITLVYPNPATDILNIHFSVSVSGPCSLEIFSNSGQKVASLIDHWVDAGTYNTEYYLKGLPNGSYLVKLLSKTGESSRQFIVRR